MAKYGTLQLAYAELYTPVLEESLEFFTKILGMSIVREEEDSYYLRGYEDVQLYSLILTQHETSGLGTSGFWADTEETLAERVKAIEEDNSHGEWLEPTFGRGRAYRFKDKDGHVMEIFSEMTKYYAEDEQDSDLPNRPQRRPLRGVPVRRLDHINYMTHVDRVDDNVKFFDEVLGFKLREFINKPGTDNKFAAWMSVSNLVHEVAFLGDNLGGSGRLHHLAFWYGIPQHLNDVADLCADWGIQIEIGPVKHGLSQALCMYVIEPGGNRIELFGDSGYLIFDPTWEPVEWTFDQLATAVSWDNGQYYEQPATYLTYGTPPIYSENEKENVFFELQPTRLNEEKFEPKIKSLTREEKLNKATLV